MPVPLPALSIPLLHAMLVLLVLLVLPVLLAPLLRSSCSRKGRGSGIGSQRSDASQSSATSAGAISDEPEAEASRA